MGTRFDRKNRVARSLPGGYLRRVEDPLIRPNVIGAEPLDAEAAWRAVTARDARWDKRFVYAVASTRVYCRPSCPARRPLRRNVSFFAAPADAEANGFRPCRRCRPQTSDPTGAERAVTRARAYLERRLETTVTLEELGRAAGMSPFHLQRMFKKLTGLSPKAYVLARRSERLKAGLRKGDRVMDATFEAGWGSASRAYDSAKLGMTPGAYGRGGEGMRICFALTDTPLGRLLVAATTRGVCAVMLGETERELERELHKEYPRAEVLRGDTRLAEWVSSIVASLAGRNDAVLVPLDLPGTAFQWKVWGALRQIPAGATRSYREVAAAIGRPTAARAVGRACASNHAAIAIPCHRVVREDGGLGGYRWGLERKRKLLAAERRSSSTIV
jgi:AraC family transcriptional regulator of adaptative response/methylated-DNA-[protein]-cysteine methyltransferase